MSCALDGKGLVRQGVLNAVRTPSISDSAAWERAETCGWCGSTSSRERFCLNGRAYVACGDCGILRLRDRVAVSRLDTLYADYFDLRHARLTPGELERQLANPTFAARHARLAAIVPPDRRSMFEIGCGDGNFLAYLSRRGWRVTGCEYGTTAREVVRLRHGLDVVVGAFAQLDLPPNSLDVVGAYAVLEHLYEPLPWLRAIRRALRAGGVLHLHVPNVRSWDHALTGTCWSLIGFPEHVYFYEPRTLVRMLEREGFHVQSVATYDPWHGPGNVVASARNLAKHCLTGWEPWQVVDDAQANNAGAAASGPSTTTRARIFDTIARPPAAVFARLESWFGHGNNLDVIATVDGGQDAGVQAGTVSGSPPH